MPAGPRRQIVAQDEVGVYHCWNRCVQRAFLCGKDPVTRCDYEYRREWVQQMQTLLARLFAMEIAFHAEMSNHIHVIVRTRHDVVDQWSDAEVVRRWLCVAKLKRNGADSIVEPTRAQIENELREPARVAVLRRRLADVSWFMGTLCESISRRCNRDAGTSGAFWEHRFGCRRLVDEASILVCGVYVDLNAIRAGEAETPEQSRHTSAFDRIQGLLQRDTEPTANSPLPDRWLCELTLQDHAAVDCSVRSRSPWRASDKGILSISLPKYLELLDWTGRQIRHHSRGAIPATLAPILDRLQIAREQWLQAVHSFDRWFGRVVGSSAAVRSLQGRLACRFHGSARCAEVFG